MMMMINWKKNPYSANTITSLNMISQAVLIFTHAVFVERPITSHKGVGRARKFSGNIYILNGYGIGIGV
jgi:hypothetical protein